MIEVKKNVKFPFPQGTISKQEDAYIFFIEKGEASVEIDFRPFTLEAGQQMMLSPLATFLVSEQSEDFRCSYIHYSNDVGKELTMNIEPPFFAFLREYPVAKVPEAEQPFAVQLIDQLIFLLEKTHGEHRMMIVKNHLMCFLFAIYDRNKENFQARKKANVSNQEYYFMKFLALVHEYAATERELGFYAEKLCITPRYLSSIVRNQTDNTAKGIIDEKCLQEIKIRLRTTPDTFQSIAMDMHFPDQSFFSRYFKKLTGMTPKEFRAGK